MRALALTPLLAAACAPDGEIEHTAALRGEWTTVVVGAHGGDLHLETATGEVTRQGSTDGRVLDRFDPLPSAPEALLDVVEVAGTARVLASGPAELFDWQGASVDEPLLVVGRADGVRGARVTDRGTAALRDDPDEGCVVDWVFADDIDTVPLPAAACVDACVVADRSADRLLVSAGGTTWSVDPVAATSWASPGNLCAFDAQTGTLAVAADGGTLLEAVGSDGTPRWATELPGPIQGVGDLGEGAAIVVTLTKADGAGQLVLLDGATGDPLSAVETPRPGIAVAGGGQGRVLALLLAKELHVFQVTLPARSATGGLDSGGAR